MTLAEGTLVAFTAFSGLRLISYLPQIHKVARDTNGASAISYLTWLLWTASHISTGFYAAINLRDPLLAIASALYALCCLAVIALTVIKRSRNRLRPEEEAHGGSRDRPGCPSLSFDASRMLGASRIAIPASHH